MRWILALIIFVAALTALAKFVPNISLIPELVYEKLGFYPSSEKLMKVVNNWRISQGFQTYIEDPKVCKLADSRINEVLTDQSHEGFFKRIKNKSFDFTYTELGENLIFINNSENLLLKRWLNSPEHYKNLIHNFKYSCIRCKKDSCVQIFSNF